MPIDTTRKTTPLCQWSSGEPGAHVRDLAAGVDAYKQSDPAAELTRLAGAIEATVPTCDHVRMESIRAVEAVSLELPPVQRGNWLVGSASPGRRRTALSVPVIRQGQAVDSGKAATCEVLVGHHRGFEVVR